MQEEREEDGEDDWMYDDDEDEDDDTDHEANALSSFIQSNPLQPSQLSYIPSSKLSHSNKSPFLTETEKLIEALGELLHKSNTTSIPNNTQGPSNASPFSSSDITFLSELIHASFKNMEVNKQKIELNDAIIILSRLIIIIHFFPSFSPVLIDIAHHLAFELKILPIFSQYILQISPSLLSSSSSFLPSPLPSHTSSLLFHSTVFYLYWWMNIH